MHKSFYTIIAVILVLGSFSFAGIAFMDHSGNGEKCPLSVLSSADCDTVVDASTSIFHQISASQTLTETPLLEMVSVALVVLALLIIVLFRFGNSFLKNLDISYSFERFVAQEKLGISIPNPILKWIALHNKVGSHLYLKKVVI